MINGITKYSGDIFVIGYVDVIIYKYDMFKLIYNVLNSLFILLTSGLLSS